MNFEVLIHEIELSINAVEQSKEKLTDESDPGGMIRLSDISIVTTLGLILIAIKKSLK